MAAALVAALWLAFVAMTAGVLIHGWQITACLVIAAFASAAACISSID